MRPILLIALSSFFLSGASAALKVGDTAPDFKLSDADGKEHTLGDYKGSIVALYFYPKNDTPGCTKQGCSLRDGFSELKEKNVVVLGISYDDIASHKKFRDKYNLPFTLLSDADKSVAKAYDVAGLVFAKRVTYIIDQNGKILHIINKVDTSDHAKQILDLLDVETR